MSRPTIEVLSSINPIDRGDYIESPNLDRNLVRGHAEKKDGEEVFIPGYDRVVGDLWTNFTTEETGSLDEHKAATSLASYYLLKTAQQVQGYGRDKVLWSERFAQASRELHGTTEPSQVAFLADQQLKDLSYRVTSERQRGALEHVEQIYSKITETGSDEPKNKPELNREQLSQVTADLHIRYEVIFRELDQLHGGPYTSLEVREICQRILNGLSAQEKEWMSWDITNTPGKAMFSVSSSNRAIDIPDGRADVKTKQELTGLLLHEIGVHAARAVGGYTAGNKKLASGMPGYVDFEEGFGIFVEYVATGKMPDKASDRYIDIALASGVNGIRLSRTQLIDLAIARLTIRFEDIEPEGIEKEARDHINRIFRGGNGVAYYNDDGTIKAQAVFSKDLSYFVGFPKVVEYIKHQLDAGYDVSEVLDYLLCGKFDPTIDAHAKYVAAGLSTE